MPRFPGTPWRLPADAYGVAVYILGMSLVGVVGLAGVSRAMPTIEEENEALKKRIAELAEMLNNARKVTQLELDSERDACVRTIRFLAENETNADRKSAFKQAAESVKNRRDPAVRWVSEMAHGTMLEEFIGKMVEEKYGEKLKAQKAEFHAEMDKRDARLAAIEARLKPAT